MTVGKSLLLALVLMLVFLVGIPLISVAIGNGFGDGIILLARILIGIFVVGGFGLMIYGVIALWGVPL